MLKRIICCLVISTAWACGDDEQTPSNNVNNSNNSNNVNVEPNNGVVNNQGTNNQNNLNNTAQCEVEEDVYDFFNADCQSTVRYEGQIARQVLIKDLSSYMLSLQNQIDGGTLFPEEGDIVGALDFYFRFDGDANGQEPLRMTTDPPTLQENYIAFGTGKNLVGKIAGNDPSTDHRDWSTEFAGWSDESIAQYGGSISNPENFVTAMFHTIEHYAIERANGNIPTDPVTDAPLPLHITPTGLDLQQLIEKFLHVSIGFSQGADDYLDDNVDGKGLLASNAGPDGDNPWTPLAHQWDEAFGYFGASRVYIQFTDDEIAERGGREDWQLYTDYDGDGRIDLNSEYNFGASGNAAKRDRGALALGVEVDLTSDIWAGFYNGRRFIADIEGALSPTQLDELRGYRDQAVLGWEKAYMATVLHYINDTLQEMAKFGDESYSFVKHAKVWAEAKGFAFAPLYNRNSPLSLAQYIELHEYLGDAPVLSTADPTAIETYKEGLRAARELLANAYDFDARLIGGADGEDGW